MGEGHGRAEVGCLDASEEVEELWALGVHPHRGPCIQLTDQVTWVSQASPNLGPLSGQPG